MEALSPGIKVAVVAPDEARIELAFGAGVVPWRQVVAVTSALRHHGIARLVLDVSTIDPLTPEGANALCATHDDLLRAGGWLTVTGASPAVTDALRRRGLGGLLLSPVRRRPTAATPHVPPLQVTVDPPAPTVVVTARGEVCISTVPDLRRALEDAAATAGREVVVDLAGTTLLTAAGVTEILRILRTCEQRSLRLRVRGATGMPARVLELCGMGDLVDGGVLDAVG